MIMAIMPCDIQELLNPIDRAQQIAELEARIEHLLPKHENLPTKAEYQNILEAHRLDGEASLLRTGATQLRATHLGEALYGGAVGKAYVDAALCYWYGEDAIQRIVAGVE